MGAITLHQRLTAQLTPISGLMDEIIDTAHDQCSIKSIGKTWPGLRRDAHRARICGIVVWAHVADGLVEAAAEDRFPDGFAVLTTDKQHNSGRYLFRFPGGVLTIRRTPHDDEKSEGQFMQETFREMIEELDKAALPDKTDAARVWIRIAPKGATTFVAQDRHGHQVKVPLADLLQNAAASVQPVSTSPPAATQVRSRLASHQGTDAK
jgi:hypothetical protein